MLGGHEALSARGGFPVRFFRATFARAHPLIRLSYLPRVVALTFAGLTLPLSATRPFQALDAAFMLTTLPAPHLWFFGSTWLWNTRAAGRAAMVVDAIITGAAVVLYGADVTVGGPCVVVTWSNAISVGGLPFLRDAAAAMAAAALVTYALVPEELRHAALSPHVELVVQAFLAFYMCVSAFSVRRQARRLNTMRGDLARANEGLAHANDELERRVEERTAALASTNAAISRFVPMEFLQALGHDDVTGAKLGDASVRSLTVLFADLRDFTASCEGMTPEETFAFLNACLSRLGPHVRAEGGFVDKYIGDAIMALFPRDPSDAVRAAIAMQRELRTLGDGAQLRGTIAVGVGIHHGRVMMGTIGEAERFEATVISDAVNLTARLESLTKQLGCSVLISGAAASALDAGLLADIRRVGTFVVKGKTRAVAVHEVFAADDDALRGAKRRSRAAFEAMLSAHEAGCLDEAFSLAQEVYDACPTDGPAAWWFARLASEVVGHEDGTPRSIGAVFLDEK